MSSSNDTAPLPDGSILRAVLEKLAQFSDEATPPDEALVEFAALSDALRTGNTSPRLDLVWEVENYTHAVHYDALLRPASPAPGAGTVSLSYCPDRGLPWPLRHAHHARESDVASVNGHLIQVQSVMARLDFVWGRSDLMRTLVDEALITREAEARGIIASDAEVQAEVDAFRQARGLFTAQATHAHLAERGWDEERLVMEMGEVVGGRLLQHEIVPDAAVVAELEKPGVAAALDTARIARFSLPASRAEEAQALAEDIRSGRRDFFEVAAEAAFAAASTASPAAVAAVEEITSGGTAASRAGDRTFLTVRRGSLSPRQAEAIFSAHPDETIGPLPAGEGLEILRVLGFTQARPDDPATFEAVRAALFARWLEEKRKTALVEWFWGVAGRTDSSDPEDIKEKSLAETVAERRGGA